MRLEARIKKLEKTVYEEIAPSDIALIYLQHDSDEREEEQAKKRYLKENNLKRSDVRVWLEIILFSGSQSEER